MRLIFCSVDGVWWCSCYVFPDLCFTVDSLLLLKLSSVLLTSLASWKLSLSSAVLLYAVHTFLPCWIQMMSSSFIYTIGNRYTQCSPHSLHMGLERGRDQPVIRFLYLLVGVKYYLNLSPDSSNFCLPHAIKCTSVGGCLLIAWKIIHKWNECHEKCKKKGTEACLSVFLKS